MEETFRKIKGKIPRDRKIKGRKKKKNKTKDEDYEACQDFFFLFSLRMERN